MEELENKLNGCELVDGRRRIALPYGQIITSIKTVMNSPNADDAAKSIGIDRRIFHDIKKLLVLQNRPTVSIEDRERIAFILEQIDRDHSYGPVRKMAHEILERNWRGRGLGNRKDIHRERRRFEATMIAIRETCGSMHEMKLPADITPIERDATVGMLAASLTTISIIIGKLVGKENENERT